MRTSWYKCHQNHKNINFLTERWTASSNAKVFMCLCVGGGEWGGRVFRVTLYYLLLIIIPSDSHHTVLYYSLNYTLCFTFVFVFLSIYYYTWYFALSTCMLIMDSTKDWKMRKRLKSIDDAIFIITSKILFRILLWCKLKYVKHFNGLQVNVLTQAYR